MNLIPILAAKNVLTISKLSGRNGSTWPGHVALNINNNLVKEIVKKNPQLRIILIAGTNGKTTTAKMVYEILENKGLKVFRNEEGANLLNGITSALISHSNLSGKINYDVAIFEVDENSLPIVADNTNPYAIVLLNLFRDQLDRYGEVNAVAQKWQDCLSKFSEKTILISNGDDPMLSYIAEQSKLKSFYFGLTKKDSGSKSATDRDFLYCPKCSTKLDFEFRTYSHMGKFSCPKCGFKNPMIHTYNLPNPLLGEYNLYNINACALLLGEGFDMDISSIKDVLSNFSPAFGRQEKIKYKNREILIMLSKNPASFNRSIDAILEKEKSPHVLFVLNDRIPDGTDVSWIWDIETDEISQKTKDIFVSGDRAFDMALRIKYSDGKFSVFENLQTAIDKAVASVKEEETLYVLPTYSAMLEVRKILTGKKIL